MRELKNPTYEVEDDDGGLRLRFLVPGSTLGAVEVVLSYEAAEGLQESLDQAMIFAGADGGDSDGASA